MAGTWGGHVGDDYSGARAQMGGGAPREGIGPTGAVVGAMVTTLTVGCHAGSLGLPATLKPSVVSESGAAPLGACVTPCPPNAPWSAATHVGSTVGQRG